MPKIIVNEESEGRLTALQIDGRDEAIVYFEDKPVLFLHSKAWFYGPDKEWGSDHTIIWTKRIPPFEHGCLDAVVAVRARTLKKYLNKLWEVLSGWGNGLTG